MNDRDRRKRVSLKLCPDCNFDLTYDPCTKCMVCGMCGAHWEYAYFMDCKREFKEENKQEILNYVSGHVERREEIRKRSLHEHNRQDEDPSAQ